MKRNMILLLAITAVIAAGCAKEQKRDSKETDKTYFEAWVQSHYPEAERVGYGVYILEQEEGTGPGPEIPGHEGAYELWPFVWVDYTVSDLEGTIASTTYEDIDKQLGLFSKSNYYGPRIWCQSEAYGDLYQGLTSVLSTMHVGERRKAAIPYWLCTYSRYTSESEYLKKAEAGGSHVIYDITLRDYCYDIKQWQGEQLDAYAKAYLDGADSTYIAGDEELDKFGFYFVSKGIAREEDLTYEMPSDTTLYLNYTAKFLDGKVFDTTIKNTAKDAGIYSPSKTYSPIMINRSSTFTQITYGNDQSDLVDGFQAAIYLMHPMEKAVTAFWSDLGYGAIGSGTIIPPYTPLVFELELVAKPE